MQSVKFNKGGQAELEDLLMTAEEEFPGVSELLKVYGGYEEMVLAVKQYLEATQPQPFITTSNQSCPVR